MGTFISSHRTCDLAMAKESCQSAAGWLMPTIQQLSVLHNTSKSTVKKHKQISLTALQDSHKGVKFTDVFRHPQL